MTRLHTDRTAARGALSWDDEHPSSFYYSTPPEIEQLKQLLEQEDEEGRPTAPARESHAKSKSRGSD